MISQRVGVWWWKGHQMQYQPTVAVSMATLWPPNTTAPITLENQWRAARNILTKGEGGGEQSGQQACDWSAMIGEGSKTGPVSMCNKQASPVSVWGSPHEVDCWLASLDVYFDKLPFSKIELWPKEPFFLVKMNIILAKMEVDLVYLIPTAFTNHILTAFTDHILTAFTNHILTAFTNHILTAFTNHILTAFTNHILTTFTNHILTRPTCSRLPHCSDVVVNCVCRSALFRRSQWLSKDHSPILR